MSVDKNAMKESGPRPDSTHRLPTAAFSERLCDADISKKEFNENVRNLLLHKQLYTPPVFDPKLAHAYALSTKVDTVYHHQDKPSGDACNTDSFQVLPENTGIPYEFRIPEFYNRISCSGEGIDVTASPKATRSLLIVCPRVPPIMRYLGTDQATLNLSCQTGCLTQFTELRQGELIPGLYARVEVPVGVELKLKYCVQLSDGQVVATETDFQIVQNRGLDADREVYYITPKLGQWIYINHYLTTTDAVYRVTAATTLGATCFLSFQGGCHLRTFVLFKEQLSQASVGG
ncbi:hypothetical protein NP493_241g06039 [Ridgeia piscesae]|uniref:Uncharacterized protein n=1 Tax=Ridgeia piscesae TaxID=27915 RepID=A0AAD9NZH8_RIDPI|nr:hypothetical protein NP493_241g06039 [Ridgeia piscesae]